MNEPKKPSCMRRELSSVGVLLTPDFLQPWNLDSLGRARPLKSLQSS
jgi:hypothetical protein